MTSKLNITPLQQALAQLKTSLDYGHSDLTTQYPDLFFQFRAAAIQAFEYSFELSIKFIRRRLEMMETSTTQIDALDYRDILRLAAERKIKL